MTINVHTKISSLLKQHPGALETIISISPAFKKLRNPILRKVIAARTSIAMASKLGGCRVEDFFKKLQPLGFEIDRATVALDKPLETKPVPGFMQHTDPADFIQLDVRPVIAAGKDPLDMIMQKIKILQTGQVLKLINSFEPVPLIHLLGKQGFESFTETVSDELVYTCFYKQSENLQVPPVNIQVDTAGWDDMLKRFAGKLEKIDVRDLAMPLPMHTILEALEYLPAGKALFVYHKRIPVFLLPELEAQHFNYRVNEVSDGQVQLLIYKD